MLEVLFTPIMIGCMFFCACASTYMATRKISECQKWLMITYMLNLFCVILYYYQVKSETIDDYVRLYTASFMLKSVVELCYIKFVAHYCGLKISKTINNFLIAANGIMVLVIGSNHATNIIFTVIERKTDFVLPYVDLEYHTAFYVIVAILGIIMFCCTVAVYFAMIQKEGLEKSRLILMFWAGFCPLIGLIIEKSMPVGHIDLVTIGFTISDLLIFIAVAKYGLLDTLQIAKESIVDNAKEGIIVVDTEYNVIFANDKVVQVVSDIYDLTEEEHKKLIDIFKEGESVLHLDGKNYEIRCTTLYEDKKLHGYMAWVFDMSFINTYTDEVLKLKDEAEKANEAKSAFLANMSHEIRTPMNAIVGFSELILQQEHNPQETQNYAYDIKRSAKNLLSIINDILNISKIESGKMELVEEVYYTQSLLEDVNSMIKNQAQSKGLDYVTEISPDIPYKLKGDVNSIREVLINILNNSVKYTREGEVNFNVSCRNCDENSMEFVFVCSDSGIGMKEEYLKQIFDKFTQFDAKANKSIEGTGLGMTIVKGLIDKMNGTIDIQSEYGIGTCTTIIIRQEVIDSRTIGEVPINQEYLEEKTSHKPFIVDATILVVDDNEINLQVANGLMKKYQPEIDNASSGKEAIKMVQNKHYDLVFMDHMMPEMDGVEAMRKIRELNQGKYKDLVIIALTANAISGVKEQMIEEGFNDYLSKPIDIWELENVLLHNLPPSVIQYVENVQEERFEKTRDVVEQDEIKTERKEIDTSIGIKNCGGTVEQYEQILKIVLKYGDERVKRLQKMMEQEDYERFTIDVHALKSTAANIGAMELSKQAFTLEMAGKEKNYDLIIKEADDLIQHYQTVLDEVQKMLSDGNSNMEEVSIKEKAQEAMLSENTIELEKLKQIIENVSEMIEEFELDKAEQILEEIQGFTLLDVHSEYMMTEIKKALASVKVGDVEEAITHLTLCLES